MTRVLLLDRGNLSLKSAIAESGELRDVQRSDPGKVADLIGAAIESDDISGVSFSSVVPEWGGKVRLLLGRSGIDRIVEIRHDIALPFRLGVESPERLGADRIAAAAGASARGAQEAVIVDAGTAVTVDLLSEGLFHGGAIFPGAAMLSLALHEQTAALPLVSGTNILSELPGRSTEAAISAGITWGLVGAVRELVRRTARPGAPIWLTGGDCALFAGELEGEIHVEPDLVLIGLLDLFGRNAGS